MVSGANFLTGIILARFLGLEGFGVFTLVWALYLFSYAIQEGLIIFPMMSVVPKLSLQEQPAYFGAVFTLSFVYAMFAALLLAATLAVGNALGWKTGGFVAALFWVVLFRLLQDFIRRYFFVTEKPHIALLLDSVCYLGQLGAIWALLAAGYGQVKWVLYAHAFTAAVSVLLSLIFMGTLRNSWPTIKVWAKRNWDSSRWLTLSELAEWVTNYSFIAAAGALTGVASVGAIRAAQNIMGVSHIFLLGLDNVLPAMASAHFAKEGWVGLIRFARKASYLVVGLMLLFVLVVGLFPEFWLQLFYGPEYAGYGHVVLWMGAYYVMLAIVIPPRIILRTIEDTRPIFSSFLVTAVLSLVLAFPLARVAGLSGILAGMFIVAALRPFMLWRGVRKSPHSGFGKSQPTLAGGE